MNMKKAFCLIILLIFIVGIIGLYLYKNNTNNDINFNIKGDKEILLKLNEEYLEPGIIALINNKDISNEVEIEGQVDTNTPGEYEITYILKRKKQIKRLKRKIKVIDDIAPSIDLKGQEEITIYENDKYKEEGATSLDNYDKDLSDKIEIQNNVNTKKPGTYEIIYKVKDSSGNEYTKKRIVVVRPTTTKKVPTTKKPSSLSDAPEKTGQGLPILMYHYFYDAEKGEEGKNANYMEIHSFEAQLKYLKDNNYYFPTWDEVADFVDGKITLPQKSVVITIDDGQTSFFKLAIPVINKMEVPVTSFIITSKTGGTKFKNYQSKYITYQSHTDSMHKGGCSGGHGGLFRCISYEKGLADLNKSISILGTSDALAYPYGDVTDRTLEITKASSFKVAVTTKYGKAKKGMDKLRLPRVRMSKGVTIKDFVASL